MGVKDGLRDGEVVGSNVGCVTERMSDVLATRRLDATNHYV